MSSTIVSSPKASVAVLNTQTDKYASKDTSADPAELFAILRGKMLLFQARGFETVPKQLKPGNTKFEATKDDDFYVVSIIPFEEPLAPQARKYATYCGDGTKQCLQCQGRNAPDTWLRGCDRCLGSQIEPIDEDDRNRMRALQIDRQRKATRGDK